MTIKEVFDKHGPMTQLALNPQPGKSVADPWVSFSQINQPVGRLHSRYYVVFLQGDDTEHTRFFITNSGARSYFEHLIGSNPKPNHHPDAPWGWYSVEEMKKYVLGV